MKKLNVLLTGVLTAVCAVAANPEKFEDGTAGEKYTNWDGDGYVKSETIGTYVAGRPGGISESESSSYVLSVEGSVTNGTLFSEMVVNTRSQVDMMVKVAYPDEALELPSGETGVQIAVGIDTNGVLNVYCVKPGDSAPAFYPVSEPIASNIWIRVSFDFDYTTKLCQVLLDGAPCVSQYGYAQDSTPGTATGSWYALANSGATKLTSMKIVGTTAIDDVYTSQNTGDSTVVIPDSAVVADTATGANVKKSWLVEQGVSTNVSLVCQDGSGMTVAQKYLTGLSVNDEIKFELKDLQPATGSGNESKMVFSFPGTPDNADFKIYGGSSPATCNTVVGTECSSSGGNSSITVDISSLTSGVKYFKAVAVPK